MHASVLARSEPKLELATPPHTPDATKAPPGDVIFTLNFATPEPGLDEEDPEVSASRTAVLWSALSLLHRCCRRCPQDVAQMMLEKQRVRVQFPPDENSPPSSQSRVEHHQLTSLLLQIVLLAGTLLRFRFLGTAPYDINAPTQKTKPCDLYWQRVW